MGAADRYKRIQQQTAKKPVILCDVSGTLLYDDEPNTPLIALLNRAKEMGFDIKVCSGAIDENCFGFYERELRKTKLNPELIDNARGKNDIEANSFSNVVAIIDNDLSEDYIAQVKAGNPQTKHFFPDDTQALLSHLNTVKPRGASVSNP